MPATLPISETFCSFQGEGLLTGVPSWFCRLSGCNLRCRWCDTPYASWKPEHTPRTVDSLLEESIDSGIAHAVITGGEPLIFNGAAELCERLRASGSHVTIETAGTIAPDWVSTQTCDLISISPKLANSTPLPGDERDPDGAWRERHESRRIDLHALAALIARCPYQLKFVIASGDDLPEIESLLGSIKADIEPRRVMLMPEGVAAPSAETERWVKLACAERGWSYCPRVHITVFGDTRGT